MCQLSIYTFLQSNTIPWENVANNLLPIKTPWVLDATYISKLIKKWVDCKRRHFCEKLNLSLMENVSSCMYTILIFTHITALCEQTNICTARKCLRLQYVDVCTYLVRVHGVVAEVDHLPRVGLTGPGKRSKNRSEWQAYLNILEYLRRPRHSHELFIKRHWKGAEWR